MSKLPDAGLPEVRDVKEVYSEMDPCAFGHVGFFSIIALDHRAGRKHRYSVLHIDYQTGQVQVTGRELRLKEARKISRQPPRADLVNERPD